MSTAFLKEQCAYVPEIVGDIPATSSVVCGGMGGSALHARVLQGQLPHIQMHTDYGVPENASPDALYIATSYSGETEETLSFFNEAQERGYRTAVIAAGGSLLAKAKAKNIPYIEVPSGREPRDAFLVLVKALLALLGEQERMAAWSAYPDLEEETLEEAKLLATSLEAGIPLIYSSQRNEPAAYLAKITLNETAKVPAFSNTFPELNHNEIQGLDPLGKTAELSEPLVVVLYKDASDHERIQVRMDALEEVLRKRNVKVVSIAFPEGTYEYKVLWSLMLVRTAAHLLADTYGVMADATPLIADFKKLL
ncbi:hypothetical protein KKG57_00385 [Patescibacteria group bacterium]|nr:hypothetical protein [Patescibacteria group bacterium]